MTQPSDDNGPGCTQCARSAQQLASLARGFWECSHVACPQRRPVTAAPPTGNELAYEGSGCWHVRPKFQDE